LYVFLSKLFLPIPSSTLSKSRMLVTTSLKRHFESVIHMPFSFRGSNFNENIILILLNLKLYGCHESPTVYLNDLKTYSKLCKKRESGVIKGKVGSGSRVMHPARLGSLAFPDCGPPRYGSSPSAPFHTIFPQHQVLLLSKILHPTESPPEMLSRFHCFPYATLFVPLILLW
jgi:hypothetical protein